MRMILFFDLPTTTKKNLKEYRKFRKFLIDEGFIMMQESVYSKLLLNNTAAKLLFSKLENNKPPAGLVQVLIITEKQYASIAYVVGENVNKILDSDSRIVII